MSEETSKIQVLDDNTINKIAAGEVVERPSAIIREVVENAIDAGANDIRIDLELGGTKLIKIQDNGCGMNRTEAQLALQRHATSKIRSDWICSTSIPLVFVEKRSVYRFCVSVRAVDQTTRYTSRYQGDSSRWANSYR